MELIDIVPGRFDAAVNRNSVPYLILDDEHSDFLQLLSKFLISKQTIRLFSSTLVLWLNTFSDPFT